MADKVEHIPTRREPAPGLNLALASITHLIGDSKIVVGMKSTEYFSLLGESTIKEIIRRFQEVLDARCDPRFKDFVMPQVRAKDHYTKGEKVYYIPPAGDNDDEDELRIGTVDRIESNFSGHSRVRSDLHVFIGRDRVPLRCMRILSEKELKLLSGGEGLYDALESILLYEQHNIKLMREFTKDIVLV